MINFAFFRTFCNEVRNVCDKIQDGSFTASEKIFVDE